MFKDNFISVLFWKNVKCSNRTTYQSKLSYVIQKINLTEIFDLRKYTMISSGVVVKRSYALKSICYRLHRVYEISLNNPEGIWHICSTILLMSVYYAFKFLNSLTSLKNDMKWSHLRFCSSSPFFFFLTHLIAMFILKLQFCNLLL